MIMVGAVAGRWGGPGVADLLVRVFPLHGAGRRLHPHLVWDTFGKSGGAGGNLVDHPMDERFGPGRIGVFDDQRQLFGSFGEACPVQAWRDVLAILSVLARDRFVVAERRAGDVEAHWGTSAIARTQPFQESNQEEQPREEEAYFACSRVRAAFFAAAERARGPLVRAAFRAAADRSAALRLEAAECACRDNAACDAAR